MNANRIVNRMAIAAIVFGVMTIRSLFWVAVTIVSNRAMKGTPKWGL